MKLSRALFLLVVPCRVLAFPLAYNKSTVTAKTYVPLVVVSIFLFFLLVAIKLVYMKHRIGTIHAPPRVHSIPTGSNLSSRTLRDKPGNWHRGCLVGCLGSPTWETDLTSRLDVATWRREQRPTLSPFVHQRHTGSTARTAFARMKSRNTSSSSRLTKSTVLTGCSTDADQFILPLSSGHSRILTAHSGRPLQVGSVQRTAWTRSHPGYGDFGESRRMGPTTRRASPSSIRLVDGPSYSRQVEYSFLSGLPPDAIVVSPLMSTRDSFQLSRCSSKCNRRAVPPLPPLPSFLPFHLPEDSEALVSFSPTGGGYLPPLRFSPLVSVAKVFHRQQQALVRNEILTPDENGNIPDDLKVSFAASRLASSKVQHGNNTGSFTSTCVVQDTPPLHIIPKTNHKKSQSYRVVAIKRTSPRTDFVTDAVPENRRCNTMHISTSCNSSGHKKPLKSCLRQNIVCSPESLMSETTSITGRSTACESLWTPISDVDIGILGLNQFHWNDEQSCHIKRIV